MKAGYEMDLINRYLHAVRFWLPKSQQEDIIAELGEDLRSKIDEREAVVGHPLDDDGVAAILVERGDPMLVASRFLPQRSLIGPALFPAYQFVLKLVIFWILTPVFVLVVGPATILAGGSPSAAIAATAWTLLMAAVFAFGVITLIFAILERYPFESNLRWNPRRLPRVPPARTNVDPQFVSRFTAIVETLAGLGAALLWIQFLQASQEPGGERGIHLAHRGVAQLLWPILLVALARAAMGAMAWLRPWWMKARLTVSISTGAVILIMLGALANMGPWIRVSASDLRAADIADANRWANAGIGISLGVASLITLIETIRTGLRLGRPQPAARPSSAAARR